MPIVSWLFVKTSLVFFVLTFVSGGMLLTYQSFGKMDVPWGFIVAHTHAGTVGWLVMMVMMVMGVAYWMFSLDKKRFEGGRGRYQEGLALASYWLVCGGLVIRMAVEPLTGRNLGPFRNRPERGGANLRVGDLVSRPGNRKGGSMSQGAWKNRLSHKRGSGRFWENHPPLKFVLRVGTG